MALYLVDGHALVFRAYYAFIRQPLVNSKGEETSAVFGFLNTLLGLIDKFEPRHLAVVFDSEEKTFRHDKYPAYKANRVEAPDSLVAQIPIVYAVLQAMNIPQFSAPGFEADDILATLVKKFEDEIPVRIVSGDKDMLQLVSDRTHVIRPGTASVLDTEIGPDGVVDTIGITAEQVVDYLALTGDSSDNVPGVRGVGPKTALMLLKSYGTLDKLYEAVDSVESKTIRNKLIDGKESAFLSRELVVLREDVPLSVTLEDFVRGDMKTESLRSLLVDLEFERLIKQIFRKGESTGGAEGPPDLAESPSNDVEKSGAGAGRDYRLVDTVEALEALAKTLASVEEFAVDVETTGLDPMRAVLAGISLSCRPGEAWYVPVSSPFVEEEPGLMPAGESPGLPVETVQERLAGLFGGDTPSKIGQNIKYDAIVLANAGMPLSGISFDTMIASYCLDPSRRSHGLDALALEMFGHAKIPFKSLFDARSRVKDIRTVPVNKVTEYACEDADYTLRLKRVFEPLLAASSVEPLFSNVEMPLQEVLTRMERTGVKVDTEFLASLSAKYGKEIGRLEERVYVSVGERFNINSTPKLREVLFDRLGLKPVRKTKTGYSTDVDVLTALSQQHEVPNLLLAYRQLVKLKSTYIDAIPRLVNPATGRVHTSYNQAVASTGRLSSSDPNLQNIPIRTAEGKEIRKAFMASGPGWLLLDADYSQIELRVLAHLSGDEGLKSAFREDADIHRLTASKILNVAPEEVSDEMRSRAKAVNFGIVYGMGARGLAQSLDIDIGEAKRFIEDYFRSYPGVKRFIEETIARARENKAVTTLLGRIRQLPDIESKNGRAKAFSERIAVNTPVQGTAADIIKLAMLDVDSEIISRGLEARMILQVHDELLFEVPEDELGTMKEVVRNSMETAVQLDVPLKVDMGVGVNWLEAH